MPSVKHIVLLKFKPDATEPAIANVWRAVEDLPRQIPGVLDFTGGANTSTEGRSRGFTHSFVMTFESPAARDAYLVHPIHVAAAEKILAIAEDVVVCDHDFEAKS